MARCLLVVVALALGACGAGSTSRVGVESGAAAAALPADNPFAVESTLPHGYPPFDRIRDEHFQPAYLAGMAQQLEELERIAGSSEPPTFENTVVAMERSGRLLGRVDRVFSNLNTANTNEALQAVEREVAPLLAAHLDSIFLNGPLFARVDALYERRAELGLDPESLRLLERYHTDFVRAGARLGPEDQARLREINTELATLSTSFKQNVLDETNGSAVVVDRAEELAGLSEAEIRAAAEAAEAAGQPGRYLLALQNTTIQPVLVRLRDRALRERIHRASVSRGARDGEHDNRPIVVRIATLRAERARLLGYRNVAEYVLEDQVARTTEAVNGMLAQLAPAARASALREEAEIQALIAAQGGDFDAQAWDWAFYAEQVRSARYDFDEEALRPYFELETVLTRGLFFAAERLYGIRFEERHDLPVYHPDVRVWEVFDADGTSLGIFLGDYWARDSKQGGAWMNEYVIQSGLLGTQPVVGNHLNIPRPAAGEPTLLTLDEVETLFHEFGHALHALFSNVRYPRFSGTNVPSDFVEYPSQVNEIWALWPEVLANYARHHENGSPIPQELVDRVLAARQFNQGYETTEYVAAAMIDQAWHQVDAGEVPQDVTALETRVLSEAGLLIDAVPPRYHSTYFSHIFSGGYAAGYYSYIWAEVLDADSERWFQQHGGLRRENGQRLREMILSRGNSQDPMELYRSFAGHDPDIGPLLDRRGLRTP
jgi:peptidyl-dipeptidase Dcp